MRSAGVGVGRLDATQQQRAAMREAGHRMDTTAAAVLEEQAAILERRLLAFAEQHERELRTDAALRGRLLALADEAGCDLLGTRRGFWARLGFGQEEQAADLAARCVVACLKLQQTCGNAVPLLRVRQEVALQLKGETVTAAEVVSALRSLRPLGRGYDVAGWDEGPEAALVLVAPVALSTDGLALLGLVRRRHDAAPPVDIVSEPLFRRTTAPAPVPRALGVGRRGRIGAGAVLPQKPKSAGLGVESAEFRARLGALGSRDVVAALGWTQPRADAALAASAAEAGSWVDADGSYWYPSLWPEP